MVLPNVLYVCCCVPHSSHVFPPHICSFEIYSSYFLNYLLSDLWGGGRGVKNHQWFSDKGIFLLQILFLKKINRQIVIEFYLFIYLFCREVSWHSWRLATCLRDEFPYVHDIVLNSPNFVLIFIGLSLILFLTYIGGPNGKKWN